MSAPATTGCTVCSVRSQMVVQLDRQVRAQGTRLLWLLGLLLVSLGINLVLFCRLAELGWTL